jgi:hypothetical protein
VESLVDQSLVLFPNDWRRCVLEHLDSEFGIGFNSDKEGLKFLVVSHMHAKHALHRCPMAVHFLARMSSHLGLESFTMTVRRSERSRQQWDIALDQVIDSLRLLILWRHSMPACTVHPDLDIELPFVSDVDTGERHLCLVDPTKREVACLRDSIHADGPTTIAVSR